MASLLIGILSLTLFPLVLGYSVITIRRWVEKDTDRKGTLSELVLSGVIFELATYTVIAYVCSKVSSLMTRTASIWKYYVTLEFLGLILILGVLWIREGRGKNTLLHLPLIGTRSYIFSSQIRDMILGPTLALTMGSFWISGMPTRL